MRLHEIRRYGTIWTELVVFPSHCIWSAYVVVDELELTIFRGVRAMLDIWMRLQVFGRWAASMG